MPQPKIKVTFLLPSLVAGGAERVLSFVAQKLDKNRFTATLVIFGFEKEKAYSVEDIEVVYFNKKRVLTGIPKLFSYIASKKPDIIVSCMIHVNVPVTMIVFFFPKIKLIIREANIKSITAIYHGTKNSWLFQRLLPLTYKRASKIICQSKDMADEMLSQIPIEKSKICVINNPISDEFKLKKQTNKPDTVNYITVGRLHAEKGHLRILKILSQLKFPFHYTIIGSGAAFNSIEYTVKQLNLEHNVTFVSHTNKVVNYLAESDLFLQGSFAEGFPNALLESCAVGTPAIVFEAPGGTIEIIENGVNGFLAKDETQFLEFLNIIYEKNPFEAKKVSESVHKKFNKKDIIQKYEDVFLSTVN